METETISLTLRESTRISRAAGFHRALYSLYRFAQVYLCGLEH